MAVTRHQKLGPPLHCLFASLWSTDPLGLRASPCSHRALVPTCPLARFARVPPRGSAALTFALLHAAPPQLHLCTASDSSRSGQLALCSTD